MIRPAYILIPAAARNDRRLDSLTGDEFRVWFRLLCLTAERGKPYMLGYTSLYVLAVELGLAGEDATKDLLTRFEVLELIHTEWGTDEDDFDVVAVRFPQWHGVTVVSPPVPELPPELPAVREEGDQ